MVASLTHSNNEISFGDILDGKTQIEIPYYQRTFKWNNTQIDGLTADLTELLMSEDTDDDAHFMGALIVYQSQQNSKLARKYYVIDGQQRLTSLSLLFMALCSTLAAHDDIASSREYLKDRLLLSHAKVPTGSNLAVVPSAPDRKAMNEVAHRLLLTHGVGDTLPADIAFIPHTEKESTAKGKVKKTYSSLLKWSEALWVDGGSERVERAIDLLFRRLTFVEIFVKDPLSGPLIFDRLNARGAALTIGELVKNDIFSRSDEPFEKLEKLNNTLWEPFYKKFEDEKLLEQYFFPIGLVKDPSVKKSDVYRAFQKRWNANGWGPAEIISELSQYVSDFLLAVGASKDPDLHPKAVQEKFVALTEAGAPTSLLPFTIRVSHELSEGNLTATDTKSILDAIQSFLVRRAICGIEPTGLHAVFKNLWNDINTKSGDYGERVKKVIENNATVEWPNDETVSERVAHRRMYTSRVTKYLLLEWDRHHGGETPNIDPTIDHIFPQYPSKGTWKAWVGTPYADRLHCLGNLALLSTPHNSHIGNQEWITPKGNGKSGLYLNKTAFKSTRLIAETYEDWTPEAFEERTAALTAFVLNRWP